MYWTKLSIKGARYRVARFFCMCFSLLYLLKFIIHVRRIRFGCFFFCCSSSIKKLMSKMHSHGNTLFEETNEEKKNNIKMYISNGFGRQFVLLEMTHRDRHIDLKLDLNGRKKTEHRQQFSRNKLFLIFSTHYYFSHGVANAYLLFLLNHLSHRHAKQIITKSKIII